MYWHRKILSNMYSLSTILLSLTMRDNNHRVEYHQHSQTWQRIGCCHYCQQKNLTTSCCQYIYRARYERTASPPTHRQVWVLLKGNFGDFPKKLINNFLLNWIFDNHNKVTDLGTQIITYCGILSVSADITEVLCGHYVNRWLSNEYIAYYTMQGTKVGKLKLLISPVKYANICHQVIWRNWLNLDSPTNYYTSWIVSRIKIWTLTPDTTGGKLNYAGMNGDR